MTEEARNLETEVEQVGTQELSAEDKARARGWRPEEEFDGDPDTWVDAKEFLYRGQLMDTIHNERRSNKQLKEELESVKGSIHEIRDHFEKLAKQEVEKRLKELKQARREAMRVDDMEAVDELEEQIEDIKSEKAKIESSVKETPARSQVQLPPEITSWIKSNPWADEDSPNFQSDLAHEALLLLELEVSKTGDRTTKSLDAVKKKMEMLYPDRFPRTRPTTSVDSSAVTGAGSTNSRYASKMNPMQRKIAEACVKSGTHKTLEQYAKELHELGEL